MSEETMIPRPVPMSEILKSRDRITTRLEILHEHFGDPPHVSSLRTHFLLEVVEQPYQRRLEVGSEPIPLDLHFLSGNSGLILIANRTSFQGRGNPTPEQRREVEEAVLKVSLSDPRNGPVNGMVVPPGGFIAFTPEDASTVFLGSLGGGKASITVTVYPR